MPTDIPTPGELQEQLAAARGQIDEFEEQTRQARLDALRATVAAKHGVKAEYIDLLSGTDEGTLTAQATRLAQIGNAGGYGRPLGGNIAPKEGTSSGHNRGRSHAGSFADALFGRQD